jgi:hypothetical protein
MWRFSIAAALCLLLAGQAIAACGDKGGPGYRAPSGRCVGWADIGKTCGNPPTTRCAVENAASGAEAAADLGQKAWDAGKGCKEGSRTERLIVPSLTLRTAGTDFRGGEFSWLCSCGL